MTAGRGSIATSSRVSCIGLTTNATPTTKPIPSFGSRRPAPRIRAEIRRRRPRRNAKAVMTVVDRRMGIASLHPSYETGVSRRRLRNVVLGRQQMNQRALDRGLPGRRVDLGAEQVRHVEYVAGAFAEGGDMGGGNVEVELRDRGGQLIQQAGAIEAGDLDHGVA